LSLVIRNARVLTLAGPRPRRGAALKDLAIYTRADVVIDKGRIESVGAGTAARGQGQEIDAAGRVLMPAFIDCHTHACWAGTRLDEWQMKLKGTPYLDILKAGGGIMSTVRAVRKASGEELVRLLQSRLAAMIHAGSATIEVKSGYGLSTADELKMLRAIDTARKLQIQAGGADIILTALLGHAIDPDTPNFIDRTLSETLPGVSKAFPGIAIDVFCETGSWSLADTVRLLEKARTLKHPIRVHADQFNSLGMIPEAIRLGATSVDHLEASTDADLDKLAASSTFGVILPCCGFHVDGRYARARRFIDAGGLLALATNYNPGSAPSPSMPFAIALAVRHCGLAIPEAIAAATVNPACLLGLSDRGQVAPGQRADLLLLNHTDERMLAFEVGGDPVDALIIGGKSVKAV
jgi:imidazolonepropionase